MRVFMRVLASLALVCASSMATSAWAQGVPAPNPAPTAGPTPTPAPAAQAAPETQTRPRPATPSPAAVTPAASASTHSEAPASTPNGASTTNQGAQGEAAEGQALEAAVASDSPLPARPLNETKIANHRPTLGMSVLAGVGGDATFNGRSVALDPSFGLTLHYEVPLHSLFVVGGMFAAQFWLSQVRSSGSLGRSPLLDLSLYPKLRVAPAREIELYAKLPIGGSLNSGDDQTYGGGTGMAFGWNIWGLLGVQISTTPTSGVIIEGGAALHHFTQEVNPPGPLRNTQVETELRQFVFTLGLFAHS